MDTIGNCQRRVFSLGVSQLMHKITNLWKFELNIGQRSCKIIMKEKHPRHTKVVCFQMLDFETSKSNSDVAKLNLWKITSFSNTTLLKREPFLKKFYTINSSLLIVTK